MGSMGYQPVPPGHWPGGTEVTPPALGEASVRSVSPPFRSAGCRPAQAGSLCYPFEVSAYEICGLSRNPVGVQHRNFRESPRSGLSQCGLRLALNRVAAVAILLKALRRQCALDGAV